MIKSVTMLFAAALVAACHEERPPCQPAELSRIEAAYIREAVETCAGKTVATCEQYPAIKAKYSKIRDEWVNCR